MNNYTFIDMKYKIIAFEIKFCKSIEASKYQYSNNYLYFLSK